jgi:hypothetical protein
MYYVINDLDNPSIDEDEDDAPFLEIHEELLTNPARGWHSGAVLEDPPLAPIMIEATPHFGYQGPPPDYYDDAISLMSPRLAKVLEEVGVDNVQLFPVVINYRGTGEKYDWYAFNIVGLVAAVDISNSEIKNPGGELLINSSIDGFKVDESKTHGQLMFRLAENVMTTVVHEQVRKAVEEAGINTFSFSETDAWIQI